MPVAQKKTRRVGRKSLQLRTERREGKDMPELVHRRRKQERDKQPARIGRPQDKRRQREPRRGQRPDACAFALTCRALFRIIKV